MYDLSGTAVALHQNALAPAWLPDGRLLFARDGIQATDATLQDTTRIDDGSLGGALNDFDVDPSGSLIAAEHNQQIWLLDVATGAARELVSASKRLAYPTFSPDGTTLAFLAVADGERYDRAIYFSEVATGEQWGIEFPTSGSSNVPNGPLSWIP